MPGITRDSVIEICRALEIPLVESGIQRAALYVADELFFSGTAAEITPIRSVDRIPVGEGRRGPITERIQKAFFEITSGEREAPGEWLTFVNEYEAAESNNPSSDNSASDKTHAAERNGHGTAHAREVSAAASKAADSGREHIHVTLTE